MDTGSCTVYIKIEDIYVDISKDDYVKIDCRLGTSNTNQADQLMKDQLGGKIMSKFATLTRKTYSYLIDGNDENKKAKATEKCVVKRKVKAEDYKRCSETT